MSDSDPKKQNTPAAGSPEADKLRAEVKDIDGKLDAASLDLQTKMEMKARKQTLERQIAALEKKG